MIKIIISALNEAANLNKLLSNINCELKKFTTDFEIILCLDGTNDDSLAVIEDLQKDIPIKTLPLTNQKGLGYAYKRLFLHIIETAQDDDIVISLDADNTHSAAQIQEMMTYFQKNNLDFLVASRFCQDSVIKGFPLYRQAISKITSLALQIIFAVKKISGDNLKDYSSGYRIYSAKALKNLSVKYGDDFVREKDFIYTCEILINLARVKARIDEIALDYNYGEKVGKSKLNILRNANGLLKLIFRLKFNAIQTEVSR